MNVEDYPVLKSYKSFKSSFSELQEIQITSKDFTLGRALNNKVVIPHLGISRSHCKFIKKGDDWYIEDFSSCNIHINGVILGKGKTKKLQDGDIIKLEPTQEFVYKFVTQENFSYCSKRIKLEPNADDFINDMKIKFEASQNYEIQHIENKLQNAKDIQTSNILLKNKLESDMESKIKQLECDFAIQIENLKGEKDEIEKQKIHLLEERDAQLAELKENMGSKITELMEQITKHNEIESELIEENNQLKEKMLKEREEFLSELSRENSSKKDLLEKLEARIKEQEEVRLKEKRELEEQLRIETEQLKIAKEKELKELTEQKKKRELELMQELETIRKNLEEQVERKEEQRCQAAQQLTEQMEEMKKIKDEDRVKMEQLEQEREEILNRLKEAQENAQKSVEELQAKVNQRQIELASLAAERIQKQADQSSEVINSLQEQLEKVRNQLQSVENEKKQLESSTVCKIEEGECSKVTAEFGEMMESELQCSICAELFVSAIVLNCSHTFCKYCITMWKKKKKDCPICRAPIISECRSLVLDSFIEKAVQNLSEEMKLKRQDILKSREEEVARMNTTPSVIQRGARRTRGRGRRRNTTSNTITTTTTTTAFLDSWTSSDMNEVIITTTHPIVDLTHLVPMHPIIIQEMQEGTPILIADDVSLVDPGPTTAATGDVLSVATGDTGPQGAPSEPHHT